MLRKIKMIFVQNHPSIPSRLILNLTFLPSFHFFLPSLLPIVLPLFLYFFYFSSFHVSVCLWGCLSVEDTHECSTHRVQMRSLAPPELELQIFVNHPMWVLGTRLGSPKRALHMLNHWVIFLVPEFGFFILCNIFGENKRQYLARVVLHRWIPINGWFLT